MRGSVTNTCPYQNADNGRNASENSISLPLAVYNVGNMSLHGVQGQTGISQFRSHCVSPFSTTILADENTNGFLKNDPWQKGLGAKVIDVDSIICHGGCKVATFEKWYDKRLAALTELVLETLDHLNDVHDASPCALPCCCNGATTGGTEADSATATTPPLLPNLSFKLQRTPCSLYGQRCPAKGSEARACCRAAGAKT